MVEPIALDRRTPLEIETKLHRGLADPSRLAILRELRRGPLTAGQLASLVGLSAPRASNHLRCLLECGLVAIEPRGRYNVYRLADPAVGRLLDASARLLAEVAPLIEACLNYGPPNRRGLRPGAAVVEFAAGGDGPAWERQVRRLADSPALRTRR